MDNWTIRRADIGDAEGLSRCFDVAYAQYAERIDDLPPMSEDCAEEIVEHLVWVAEEGGTIVGGLVLVPSDGFMQLANIAVHPDNRGAGIGRRLLTLAETEAMDRGYAELRLNTHADMTENIRHYARKGWSPVHRQGNKVTMRKDLPRS
jgi:GNAT superfamily N-acetyltransferase